MKAKKGLHCVLALGPNGHPEYVFQSVTHPDLFIRVDTSEASVEGIEREAGLRFPRVWIDRVVDCFDDAIAKCGDDAEVFIAGGAEIYRQTIERADRIYLTIVHGDFPGDTKFPEFSAAAWNVVSVEQHPADDKNVAPCTFLVYDRA
jgi:hypothetical protein